MLWTIRREFGSTDFGKVKYRTGKLLPGAEYGNELLFGKEKIDFDPEKISEVSATWDSETWHSLPPVNRTTLPMKVINQHGWSWHGPRRMFEGLERIFEGLRGIFEGSREGDNEYILKHSESVVFKLWDAELIKLTLSQSTTGHPVKPFLSASSDSSESKLPVPMRGKIHPVT